MRVNLFILEQLGTELVYLEQAGLARGASRSIGRYVGQYFYRSLRVLDEDLHAIPRPEHALERRL